MKCVYRFLFLFKLRVDHLLSVLCKIMILFFTQLLYISLEYDCIESILSLNTYLNCLDTFKKSQDKQELCYFSTDKTNMNLCKYLTLPNSITCYLLNNVFNFRFVLNQAAASPISNVCKKLTVE